MEEVIRYIRGCRQKGFNDKFIRKQLKDAGHSDYIIERAFYGEKQVTKMPSVKPLMYLFVFLAVISLGLLGTLLLTGESSATGYVVNEQNDAKLIEAAKQEVLRANIEEINNQDIPLQEKEKQIQELRDRVDLLFLEIESNRQRNLQDSLELIDSILKREN